MARLVPEGSAGDMIAEPWVLFKNWFDGAEGRGGLKIEN
jgi:hypothetical protein